MPANFDRVARWYRWLEYLGFGRSLWRRRVEFLPALQEARRVLLVGEGDGRFLAALLAANSAVEVTYLDASAGMLRLARQRAKSHRVTFVQRDLTQGPPVEGEFDAIVTHFFLDCFSSSELSFVMKRLPSAPLWIVSEFQTPHRLANAVVSLLYRFFATTAGLRTIQLPNYAEELHQIGYTRHSQKLALGGLLSSELWQRRATMQYVDSAAGSGDVPSLP